MLSDIRTKAASYACSDIDSAQQREGAFAMLCTVTSSVPKIYEYNVPILESSAYYTRCDRSRVADRKRSARTTQSLAHIKVFRSVYGGRCNSERSFVDLDAYWGGKYAPRTSIHLYRLSLLFHRCGTCIGDAVVDHDVRVAPHDFLLGDSQVGPGDCAEYARRYQQRRCFPVIYFPL